ncbi:unnamed protein product (macronuclear) [Paramecium tetraurelia]|uniref:UmuC domain-containing protein n=1 Tax=Paramecium tetraurelia TaxID=5888 RepID=A0DAQ7_PARTE|nr:uncharacterized protein GSPATT00015031001 [Paramecium tetraurelia]CAK80124.1 unnamed protein product [Paramecium tetraurelia]|eukprot:XP_001447521.1 hypothetical protein (macronuclear) [Paramecium tetraurelia strain d4-2]
MNSLLQVYIHIDMDAYYAQAEQKLLNIPEDQPVCARQWNSLIAINYPARDAGIKRGMLSEEAIKLCPNVMLPHVETFKVIDGKMVFSTLKDKYIQHNQYEEKVSLRYYRQESKLIFTTIKRFCNCVEKGGTDEGYIQVSEKELEDIEAQQFYGHLMKELPEDYQLTEQDHLLRRASLLCQNIRDAIYTETKYKCSAGISFNKMLAKLASATNKPNKQTIILECMLPECISNIGINKIRGFGGKVQEALLESGLKTVGQAQTLSIYELQSLFGDKAQYIYDKLRGYDDEIVKKEVDLKNKSILSLKNIKKTSSREVIIQSLELILHDITMRVTDYYEDSNLVPSVLVIHYHNVEKGSHQKSEPIYLTLPIESFRLTIEERVHSILNQIQDNEMFPLIHIGISCRYFKPMIQGIQNPITMFFKKILEQQEYEKQAKLAEMQGKMISPDDYYSCSICGQEIMKKDKESHDDFHIAENLDKEMNPKKRKYKSLQQTNSNSQSNVNSKSKSKQQGLTSILQFLKKQ